MESTSLKFRLRYIGKAALTTVATIAIYIIQAYLIQWNIPVPVQMGISAFLGDMVRRFFSNDVKAAKNILQDEHEIQLKKEEKK